MAYQVVAFPLAFDTQMNQRAICPSQFTYAEEN